LQTQLKKRLPTKTVKIPARNGIRFWSVNVCYWHKADIGLRGHNVSCGGKADVMRT
jgi:hypothetical protein